MLHAHHEVKHETLLRAQDIVTCTVLADPAQFTNFFERDPAVATLDVSGNPLIGDAGFRALCNGISNFRGFRVLAANGVGITDNPEKGLADAVSSLRHVNLEMLSLAANPLGPRGCVCICQTLLRFERLHTLDLNECQIGVDLEAAEAIGKLLQLNPALRRLYLNHNALGDAAVKVVCDGAACSTSLQVLSLTHNGICEEEAVSALSACLKESPSIEEVNITGNAFTSESFTVFGASIEMSVVRRLHMEDMGLTGDMLNDFLSQGLAESATLAGIIMDKNSITDEGLTAVAEALSIGLTELSLAHCQITEDSEHAIMSLVSLSPNLKVLNLSHNSLGKNAFKAMVKWMTASENNIFALRSLEISSCELGDEGFVALLPIMGSLSYLGVRDNQITSDGMSQVMHGQLMIKMNCLDLADNQIGEAGLHAFTERFQQEHKRALWNPKQLTSHLDTTILSNNCISPALAASTECFLKVHNPLLQVVW